MDRERARKNEKAYRERNREAIRLRSRQRMANNPEARAKKAIQNKVWREAHPEKQKEYHKRYVAKPGKREHRRDYLRASVYGITKERYEEMLAEQDYLCYICRQPERRLYKGRPTNLVVDHNHETGEIRRLLCHACNASLGFLEEDPKRILKMLEYVALFNKRTLDRNDQ